MYPVVRASGAVSPGAGGAKTSGNGSTTVIADGTTGAHPVNYTFATGTTTKGGDVLIVFSSVDSGAETRAPAPTLTGHTFTLLATSGGVGTSGVHGRVYWTEIQTDGTKTVTMSNGGISGADTAVSWALIDGQTMAKGATGTPTISATFNTTQVAAATAQAISAQNADTANPNNALGIAFITNKAGNGTTGQGSGNRNFTAPSGWTKIQEVGSREFLDTGLFVEQFENEQGFVTANATYGGAAVYTRLNVILLGLQVRPATNLVDDFLGSGALDATLWPQKNGATRIADEMDIPCQHVSGTPTYANGRSGAVYTLNGYEVMWEIDAVPTPDGSGNNTCYSQMWIRDGFPADAVARIGFELVGTRLDCVGQQTSAYTGIGTVQSYTFSMAQHKYLKVKYDGSTFTWFGSGTGVAGSWTTLRTLTNAGTAAPWLNKLNMLQYSFEAYRTAGTNDSFKLGSVNIIPTAIQKGGTATIAVNVGVTSSGFATRRGTGPTAMAVNVSSAASSKRGPNLASVPVAVAVSTPLAQKVRPGQVANVAVGVNMQVSIARKNAIAASAIPVAVQVAPTTFRKSVSRTATVTLGVAIAVSFGQRQRRAMTTVSVNVATSTARGNHIGVAGVSMGVNVASSGYKSAQGLAKTSLAIQVDCLVPAKRKLYPQIKENYQDPQEGMRYFLQDVRSKEFLHTEFPLEQAQITLSLSGPDIIQGNFGFDIRDVDGIGLDGWSQWIHAELDGEIATSGLLLPWTYEARTNQLEANGASVYPHGIPWAGDKEYIQADPMTIMSDIWSHVQTGPMSNLGVRFIPTPTPIKLGTKETEQVEFEASTGDTEENLDARVTVKRESVTQSVWDKLLSMGYQQQGSTPLANAAAEMRNRLNSGGNVYEDFTWTGMSANMSNNHDELCDRWYGKRGENNRKWPPTASEKTQLISMLQGIINAGQGSLSVKKRDLITAQGGTPGKTATSTSGGSTEMVSFEAGGPYKLSWWESPDCGGKIDELMKVCPADYRERNYWDPYRTDVKHDIMTGYPRLGRTLTEPAFVENENMVDSIALEEDPEDFATEVWVLGAGEGRDRIRGMASLTHKNRIRRVKVVEDKSITSVKVAKALAAEILSQSQRPVSVRTVLINLDHDYARLGSFAPGDDVKVQTGVRGYGDIDLYHRVEKMSWVPKSMLCAVDLIRSDTIRYGVAAS